MASDSVSLRFAPGQPRVRLRELTGTEERAVVGIATDDALRLLDALIITTPGEPAPPRADDLVASDRDRLLVAVYQRAFGDRIENTITCARCANPFDINFSLGGLAGSLENNAAGSTRARSLGGNRFETPEGLRFRLPTGHDERAIAALPAAEAETGLLRCCAVEDSAPIAAADANALQELLAEVAPLVDLELDARCPDCRHVHALQFDIQSYLLGALLGERPRLAQEIHRIAIAYGWAMQEILSLGRHERRHFIELIDNDAAARSRRLFG
ncbi:MAG TPA: hypothetical protein VHO24_13530 [Opitutaceae bacterium]|nr:hypothetical protein [Opitutaceae bacterium]